jgi:hypothetical protein
MRGSAFRLRLQSEGERYEALAKEFDAGTA